MLGTTQNTELNSGHSFLTCFFCKFMDTNWLTKIFRLTEPSKDAVKMQNSPRLCIMISTSLLPMSSRVLSIPQLNFSLHCFESLWGCSSLRDVNRNTLVLVGIRYRRLNSYIAGQINGYGNVWLKCSINTWASHKPQWWMALRIIEFEWHGTYIGVISFKTNLKWF